MPTISTPSKHILKHGTRKELDAIYQDLLMHFGPRNWWPAESPTEMIVGAILTQSVSWRNVKTAIENLRSAGLLDFGGIHAAPVEQIEGLIRPTRYFKAKTAKLKAFAGWLAESHEGSLEQFFAGNEVETMRAELLAIHGVGPETADCILTYAAGKPSFAVDAYTRRIFSRLGYLDPRIAYEPMRRFFMDRLVPDVQVFNEFHALIDGLGHYFCAPVSPRCGECPLKAKCAFPAGRAET